MKITKRFLKKLYLPITPLLFAMSFVFAQFYAWFNEVYVKSIFLPLGIVVIFVLVLYLIFLSIFKARKKTEIFTSIFLILFFSYSAINSLSWNVIITVGKININKGIFEVFIYLLSLLLLFVKLLKEKKDLSFYWTLLFRIGLASSIVSLVLISWKQVERMMNKEVISPLKLPEVTTAGISKNKLPDIYFIEPEDDTSPAVFKKYFNYDESDFIKFLSNTGFYIAGGATSNYPKTFESLASILNMEYLDYLSKYKNSSDLTIVNPLIDNNNVMKFLRMYGYKYYQMGSWWGPTQYDSVADDNFTIEADGRVSIDSFAYNLADSTALSPFLTKIIPVEAIGDSDEDDRARLLYQFNKLPQIVNLPGPKFIFAHIIAPHAPYVFGKNCEYVNESTTSQKPETENYINQTNCINKNLESVVKTIIATSKNPPVIILLTDEGVPFLNNQLNPIDNWKTAPDTLLKEKFPMLAAFYLPGVSTQSLYQTITPVNVFRIVFNLYFKTDFPQLPDKNYIFRDLNHLYEFNEVTNTVNY